MGFTCDAGNLPQPIVSSPTLPLFLHLQMMSPGGRQPDLLTTKGGPGDWVWKMVRKGCAPAFSHNCVR